MTKYRLTLATDDETKIYEKSRSGSGLSDDLRYLERDPTAVQERRKNRTYDHMHLSVPGTDKNLVQWWGRAASGYHYPVGAVMRMIKEGE